MRKYIDGAQNFGAELSALRFVLYCLAQMQWERWRLRCL